MVIIDENGATKIVYDVNDDKLINIIVVLMISFVIITIIAVVLIKTFYKTQKEYKESIE